MHLEAPENCLQWNNSAAVPPGRSTTAMTLNFDDFFDRSYQSSERIKALMSLSPKVIPQNAHENLFCDLVREILLVAPDKKRLNEFGM